jgi:uncharacterized protein
MLNRTINPQLLPFLAGRFALGRHSDHGPAHWSRVRTNGLLLSAETGAQLHVVELFALLHDTQRQNEWEDPLHGSRGADFAHSLRGTWFDVTNAEMDLLDAAIRYHADGKTEGDVTVQTCWDADRLDLGRVGIRPDPRKLCTDVARRPDVLAAAYQRSLQRVDRSPLSE